MASVNPKPGIMDILPYKGGEAKVDGISRLVRLASNENPLGCSEKAKKIYINGADGLFRYPDGGAEALRFSLAQHYNINQEQIVCGAGSDELISLLIRAYAGVGDEVLYSQHGFLMYPIGAKAVGATPVAAPETNLRADVQAILERVTEKTKLVFIANPNNPTGSYLTRDELKTLQAGLPEHTLLIIDAAYAEYIDLDVYSSGIDLVEEHNNTVMLRTFSKIYGLAGVRLGWGYFPKHVADVINRVRGPFNVSVPAQEAGVAALSDQDFVKRSKEHNTKWLPWVSEQLQDFGLTVHPSVGNFILVDFGKTSEEKRLALKKQGIFVRQMGAYGLPSCLRITIGTEEENHLLVTGLGKIYL